MISRLVSLFLDFYAILLIFRCFLTWIPSINWEQQPFYWMRSVCDPFLNIFRGIIPPINGMIDISPILAFILLQVMRGLIVGLLSAIGL